MWTKRILPLDIGYIQRSSRFPAFDGAVATALFQPAVFASVASPEMDLAIEEYEDDCCQRALALLLAQPLLTRQEIAILLTDSNSRVRELGKLYEEHIHGR